MNNIAKEPTTEELNAHIGKHLHARSIENVITTGLICGIGTMIAALGLGPVTVIAGEPIPKLYVLMSASATTIGATIADSMLEKGTSVNIAMPMMGAVGYFATNTLIDLAGFDYTTTLATLTLAVTLATTLLGENENEFRYRLPKLQDDHVEHDVVGNAIPQYDHV